MIRKERRGGGDARGNEERETEKGSRARIGIESKKNNLVKGSSISRIARATLSHLSFCQSLISKSSTRSLELKYTHNWNDGVGISLLYF